MPRVKLWFISDTHFGHENIIRYCDRPFRDAQQMDETIIERWNEVVQPHHHVYHLGDVAMHRQHMDAVLPRLNGHKRLVRGNHDIFRTKFYLRWFEEIYGVRVIDNIIFSHIPLHPESLGRFRANVHGHTHANGSPPGRYLSVCVEQTGYRPVSLEELITWSESHAENAPDRQVPVGAGPVDGRT